MTRTLRKEAAPGSDLVAQRYRGWWLCDFLSLLLVAWVRLSQPACPHPRQEQGRRRAPVPSVPLSGKKVDWTDSPCSWEDHCRHPGCPWLWGQLECFVLTLSLVEESKEESASECWLHVYFAVSYIPRGTPLVNQVCLAAKFYSSNLSLSDSFGMVIVSYRI